MVESPSWSGTGRGGNSWRKAWDPPGGVKSSNGGGWGWPLRAQSLREGGHRLPGVTVEPLLSTSLLWHSHVLKCLGGSSGVLPKGDISSSLLSTGGSASSKFLSECLAWGLREQCLTYALLLSPHHPFISLFFFFFLVFILFISKNVWFIFSLTDMYIIMELRYYFHKYVIHSHNNVNTPSKTDSLNFGRDWNLSVTYFWNY